MTGWGSIPQRVWRAGAPPDCVVTILWTLWCRGIALSLWYTAQLQKTVLYTIHVDALETERTEKIMPPRNRILLEQRQRIIQACEDVSEDYLTVAATIGVNQSAARSIVARYLREGRIAERPRGGANHVRVDDEMRNCLNDIINENCLANTSTDKSRVEAASSTKTGNP